MSKRYIKNKIIVGVVISFVTLCSWVVYHEYEIWRDKKPTAKERVKSLIKKIRE